ncbi:hypothetical protein [Sphingobium yanoikuyae]|uniref:hypothetical protein n=1 Tax=Sphingobium yanoikuyae TaxID=13690 RepID=UPI001237350C|nr:hypothetical protein [Sphingobium yanoikuyae]
MTRRGVRRATLPVAVLIATAVVVFVAIRPAIGDGFIAAILACLTLLPFASSLLGAGDQPVRKRVRS